MVASARRDFSARYLVESFEPLEKAAEVIAGEQSCGTFVTLPGETADLRERARARVVQIEALDDVADPSLPNAFARRKGVSGPYHRGVVEVSFPVHNVGPNLPNLYATIAGNLFELGELTGLRILDLDLPDDYAAAFPGPAFGAEGTRTVAKVHGRPLVGTIIKPSVGLSPEDTAELIDTLCQADIDFIKDDELMGDPPYAPLKARVKAVMAVVNRHADRMGRKVMVAFNISDDLDAMRHHHDLVVREGGTCVMASLNWTGPAAITALRRHASVPIHGHRNGFGMLNREPSLGMDYRVYQKLWRLAGVDQLHVNGLRSKFWEPDESVIASAAACMTPFCGTRPIMPVFSSGQTASQPPDTYAALESTDLIYLAGGGIIGHPSGPKAGVQSLLEAWQAAVEGVPLARYAESRPALRDALKAFGPNTKSLTMPDSPLIAFYGDDFTGSTDALECLAATGLRSVLFVDVPTPEVLARFEGLEAVGIAGNSRSLTPDEMEAVIPTALTALRRTGAPILHYKVCSTFNSSPTIGSFGQVMDIARREFGKGTIPIVVGAPKLARYSLFGTLFARHNVDGTVHRIDRHPTMSVHPTTPMREADMRRHIGAQTAQDIALLAAPSIARRDAAAALDAILAEDPDALLMDIVDQEAEAKVGALLERMADKAPLFVLGSSGVEYALVAAWRAEGRLPATPPQMTAGAVDRIFVISGSCSPATGAQIAAAIRAGFADVALDPLKLIEEGAEGPCGRDTITRIVEHLNAGRDVVAHSSTGPSDPREATVTEYFARQGRPAEAGRIQGGRALATTAAALLDGVLRRVPLDRFVIAGGDTATAAIKHLGIDALEMVAPLFPGAPLCRALAPARDLHGRELVLKGGQMGGPEFFLQAKVGG